MKGKNTRATSNLRMLERVARKLGRLNDEVVYVGGCATALIIDDPSSLDVRHTLDVDCIVDVISYPKYHGFEIELQKPGFLNR